MELKQIEGLQPSRQAWNVGVWAAVGVLATMVIGFSASESLAERAPSRSEAHALRTFALAWCHQHIPPHAGPCVYDGIRAAPFRTRISTVNPRIAWANIEAFGLSGLLVKRPHPTGGQWKVIAAGGGDLSDCSRWYKVVSHSVSADLALVGWSQSEGKEVVCR